MNLRSNAFCATFLFVLCVLPHAVVGQGAVPTMDEIIAAARQRQEAVTSGKFEWKVKQWMRKGWKWDGIEVDSGTPNPPEDFESTHERTLILSGSNVRYENYGAKWNEMEQEFLPNRVIMIWDGAESRVFEDPKGFWHGSISRSEWLTTIDTYEPLAWTIRMLDRKWVTYDISKFSLQPAFEDVRGDPCVVIEGTEGANNPVVRRLWLSPALQYAVRRFELGRANRVGRRVDIDYENSPQDLPVPVRWTTVEGDPPGAIEECELVQFELNGQIDPDAFVLQFPPTTWVREEGVAEPYLIGEDGLHRPVTRSELSRGATIGDLVATPSGQARLTPVKRRRSAWMFWALQGILATSILFYLYRTCWTRGAK